MPAKDRHATDASDADRPVPLLVVALIVLVEAVCVAGAAGYLAVESAVGDPDDPLSSWLSGVLAALLAAGLVLVGLGLLRARRWARSPAFVVSLLLLPVGVSLLQAGRLGAGVPVTLFGVAGVVLLLTPTVTRALADSRVGPEGPAGSAGDGEA